MALEDVDAIASDDDFDVSADLAAAFDAAEQTETPAADVPAEETAQETAERVRDEKGRFATKPEEKAADEPGTLEKAAATAPQAAPVAPAPVAAETAPPEAVKPPPGFSPTAKVVWNKDSLDKAEWEAVKRDIAKRNEEVDRGFAKFAEYKPIERYVEMARNSGTTLDKALESYIGIENELKRDFISGVSRICQNQGIHPVALANQILARNGASAQPDGAGETQAHQTAPGVDLSPIHQELNSLKSWVQQQQTATVQTELQRFASDPKHTFFENVKPMMGKLINSGLAETLEEAYDKACNLDPEIRSLLIKQQSAPDTGAKVAAATQARAAAKSITGSPIPNASGKGSSISIEDEIRQLMDASV